MRKAPAFDLKSRRLPHVSEIVRIHVGKLESEVALAHVRVSENHRPWRGRKNPQE